jgi:hypothetical protein
VRDGLWRLDATSSEWTETADEGIFSVVLIDWVIKAVGKETGGGDDV